MGHEYVLVYCRPNGGIVGSPRGSYAEIAVKCRHCFKVWAANVPEFPGNPRTFYSPDEGDAIRKALEVKP